MKKYGKKYGKGISIVLFIALGVFVMLQYQNCGNSSGTNNSSVVGPSGLSYSVVLTPQTTTPTHGNNPNDQLTVQVQVSAADNLIIKTGYLSGGIKNQWCLSDSPGPVSNISVPCDPFFPQAGVINMYVEVDDTYGIELYCTNNTTPGCNGTYTLNVQ